MRVTCGHFHSNYNIGSKSVGMSERHKLKPRKKLARLLFTSRNILGSLSEQKAHLKPWRFAQPWFPVLLKAKRPSHGARRFTLVGSATQLGGLDQ